MMTCFSVSKSSTRKRRPEDVSQNVERLRQVLRQASHVIERVFFRRLRVVLGTDPIEVVVDGNRVAPIRPLECHVLEEVRHAGHTGWLVAAAGLDDEARGDGERAVVELGDDFEPIVECRVMKLHDIRPFPEETRLDRSGARGSESSAAAGNRRPRP